ncbi:MAG TPA: hypothetical protein VM782_18105 [Stellaceae bacterium]|nr:hypothetical protein [Stellaceae bacterium]
MVAARAAAILPFTIVQTQYVGLTMSQITAAGFAADFIAPTGNMPGTQNDNAFLWVGVSDPPTQVPWQQAPAAQATLNDGQQAALILPSSGTFPARAYVFAYSVGPAVTSSNVTTYPNVCATALIPSSWDLAKVTYTNPSIGVVGLTTDIGTFSFSLPQGAVPSTNGAWIGIWRNVQPLYQPTGSPVAFAAVNQTDSQGNQPMYLNGLSPDTNYTAGLFTSGYARSAGNLVTSTLCATVSFQTGTPTAPEK